MPRLVEFILGRLERLDRQWSKFFAWARHHLLRKKVFRRAGRKFRFTRAWIGEHGIEGRAKRVVTDLKRLSIVIVTYRQPDELVCLLHAMATQTLQNFEIMVMHDGPHPATRAVVHRFIKEHPNVPCSYLETQTRYNDHGHSLRQIGIDWARCEYILITNGDNYYAPRAIEFAFTAIDEHHLDLVLFDMVHSHFGYTTLVTQPLRAQVDMGAFLVKSSMAKRVGFRDRTFEGDATYLEDLLQDKQGPSNVGKLCKTVLVHN